MNQSRANSSKGQFNLRELSIVVAANNHNPTILNPDFLKRNSIISEDWELAEPPICFGQIAQVVFSNGVSIFAQPDKIIFTETLFDSFEESNIPGIVSKYVSVLSHVNYLAIGINPKGHVCFDSVDLAWNYISETLLASGSWKSSPNKLSGAAVQLFYQLEYSYFSLNISQGYIQESNTNIPIVLFAGNFHRDSQGENIDSRLKNLQNIIGNWKADVNLFISILDQDFLGGIKE